MVLQPRQLLDSTFTTTWMSRLKRGHELPGEVEGNKIHIWTSKALEPEIMLMMMMLMQMREFLRCYACETSGERGRESSTARTNLQKTMSVSSKERIADKEHTIEHCDVLANAKEKAFRRWCRRGLRHLGCYRPQGRWGFRWWVGWWRWWRRPLEMWLWFLRMGNLRGRWEAPFIGFGAQGAHSRGDDQGERAPVFQRGPVNQQTQLRQALWADWMAIV